MESEKCQQLINNRFELSSNTNLMLSKSLLIGSVTEFNTTTSITSEIRNFIELLTTKTCSSFKRMLIRNGGIIIKIIIRDKIASSKASIVKMIDKMKLNTNKNEPISLQRPSFLPRILICKTVLER